MTISRMEISNMCLKVNFTVYNGGANWTGKSKTFQVDPFKVFCNIHSFLLTVVTLKTKPYSFTTTIRLGNNVFFYHSFYFLQT